MLAGMLLIGAGPALRSFVNLQSVHPGIRPDHVLTFRMRLPTDNLYKTGREQAEFYRRVLEKVETLPGIQSAGLTDVLPLGQQNDREYFTIENRPMPAEQSLVADFRRVSPRYFGAMGLALRQGRLLSGHDADGAPPVILIDETLAHQYWPEEDPLGRRMLVMGRVAASGWNREPGASLRPVGENRELGAPARQRSMSLWYRESGRYT